ncbi:MAG: outer membrane protein assembly factor BamD [Candidatus Babeliales bacterium]
MKKFGMILACLILVGIKIAANDEGHKLLLVDGTYYSIEDFYERINANKPRRRGFLFKVKDWAEELIDTISSRVRLPEIKTIKNMNFQELAAAKDKAIKQGEDSAIIAKYLEKMISLCHDVDQLSHVLLELADLYYTLKEYDKARALYHNYADLYPTKDKTPYALYREIKTLFYSMLGADRDQTITRETIKKAKAYIQRYAGIESNMFASPYLKDVRETLAESQKRLFASEMRIVYVYIQNKKYQSASSRIEKLRDIFLAEMPHYEQDILGLEYICAFAQNNQRVMRQKQAELHAHVERYGKQLSQDFAYIASSMLSPLEDYIDSENKPSRLAFLRL